MTAPSRAAAALAGLCSHYKSFPPLAPAQHVEATCLYRNDLDCWFEKQYAVELKEPGRAAICVELNDKECTSSPFSVCLSLEERASAAGTLIVSLAGLGAGWGRKA